MIHNKKRFAILVSAVSVVLIAAVVIGIILISGSGKVSQKITVEEAQQYVNDTFTSLAPATAHGTKAVLDDMSITVNAVHYGNEKDVQLDCTYTAKNIGSITERADDLVTTAYGHYAADKAAGKMVNSTKIALNMKTDILELLKQADQTTGNVTLYLYETSKGKFELYLSDEAVDTCTGGLITFKNSVLAIKTIEYNNETIDISNHGTVNKGVIASLDLRNHETKKPDTSNFLVKKWHDFTDEFSRNFIAKARWQYLWNGLLTTLAITALAALLGIIIGFFVAVIRCTCQTTGRLQIADKICALYLTLVRGTPVMVQLLIMYFVILLPAGVDKFPAAVLCFGLNSGAYVAEIVRGGIMSVDRGQNEAGRSLGFGFAPTMIHIIIPQAFKAVLPALANEFITLLKESSVAFYIGVADLTQGGLKIRSLTYGNFMPLIAVAVIYLIIVLVLTRLVGILERRLRKSDH